MARFRVIKAALIRRHWSGRQQQRQEIDGRPWEDLLGIEAILMALWEKERVMG